MVLRYTYFLPPRLATTAWMDGSSEDFLPDKGRYNRERKAEG